MRRALGPKRHTAAVLSVPSRLPFGRLRPLVGAFLAGCALVILAACDPAADRVTTLSVTTSLSSKYKDLHNVGADNRIVYGWNDLEGTAQVGDETVQVQLLGDVEYTDGGGPFGGFVTLTFADGAVLALRVVDARAVAKTDTSDARFTGLVRVIGGTGRFVEASGRGVLEGRRNDELGGVVEMTYTVRLEESQ